MNNTILCNSKEEAKNVIDAIGWANVKGWKFFDNGQVRIYLKCSLKQLKEQK